MKPLEEWVAQILDINPDRTLDEIYHAMHCFYSKEQILTVWTPDEEEEVKAVKKWVAEMPEEEEERVEEEIEE